METTIMAFMGLGFRVLGFRVEAVGCKVEGQGLGFRVESLGCRAKGLGQ